MSDNPLMTTRWGNSTTVIDDLPGLVAQTVRNLYPTDHRNGSLVLPDALREDVESVCLIAALRACREHKPGSGSLGGFVVSAVRFAARNAVRDLTREERRFRPLPLDAPVTDAGLTVAETIAASDPTPESAIVEREWHHSLWAKVEELGGVHRDVLVLLYREGIDTTRTAARFGMSRAWVSKQRDRAIIALRSALASERAF